MTHAYAPIGDEKTANLIVSKGGVEIVLEALRTNIRHEDVVEKACEALRNFGVYCKFCVASFSFPSVVCFGIGLHDFVTLFGS
jgi:hypothetical protein